MGKREANRRSSIYVGKDGYWHGRVSMGSRGDGSPDRRHVSAKTRRLSRPRCRRWRRHEKAARSHQVAKLRPWRNGSRTGSRTLRLRASVEERRRIPDSGLPASHPRSRQAPPRPLRHDHVEAFYRKMAETTVRDRPGHLFPDTAARQSPRFTEPCVPLSESRSRGNSSDTTQRPARRCPGVRNPVGVLTPCTRSPPLKPAASWRLRKASETASATSSPWATAFGRARVWDSSGRESISAGPKPESRYASNCSGTRGSTAVVNHGRTGHGPVARAVAVTAPSVTVGD